MHKFNRRELMLGGTALGSAGALRAAVKPVRITDVDLFEIDIPVSQAEAEAGLQHRFGVAKVMTDAGVTGYSFAGAPRRALAEVKQVLVGKDLFNVDTQVHDGLGRWGGVEHAVWDAIGKIADQPVYKLLGGARDRVTAYLTCVWKGNADQQQVPFQQQVDMVCESRRPGSRA